MASMPGPGAHMLAPASPRSDAASGHDTDTPVASMRAKRKFSHTTVEQRQCLLEWLEMPGNFELLTKPSSSNTSSTTPTTSANAPKKLKKIDGYRSLAQYMNRVAHTQWTDKTARSRFESLIAAFRKAKREDSHKLQSVYQRLDALYCSPEGDAAETRFRSESLGQRSESSRSPHSDVNVSFSELKTFVNEEQRAMSPPRRRARYMDESVFGTSTPTLNADVGAEESVTPAPLEPPTTTTTTTTSMSSQTLEMASVGAQTATSVEPSPLTAVSSVQLDQAAMLESQRLAVRQQELELKQSELRARQEESRHKLRAEVLTRLVEAGKSPAEVREYLAIMDPVETTQTQPPPTRR